MKYATGVGYDRGTGKVTQDDPNGLVRPEDPTAGRVRDPLSYGGYAATTVQNPDGSISVDYGKSGRNDAVNRFVTLGEAAANREAHRANYTSANADMARGLEARGHQTAAIGALRGAAQGNAPSATTGLGSMMADQTLQQQMAASAGARGLGAAAAAQQAQVQAAGQYASNAANLAGMRGGEMMDARGAYMGGTNALRGQDYNTQRSLQQREMLQAESEMAQRQLNQQDQMGYEGLAYGARQAERNAQMQQDETDAGILANSLKIEDAEKNRALAQFGTGVSAGGAGLAAAAQAFNAGGSGGGRRGGGIIRDNPYGDG